MCDNTITEIFPAKWPLSVHQTLDQRKRILYGLQIPQKDICCDVITKTAYIKSHTKKTTQEFYTVTLNSCDCYDFVHRNLPCKHMYALCFAIIRYLPGID